MALTMRPTDLDRSPATAHFEDWIVLDDGKPIGRIYQRHAPASAVEVAMPLFYSADEPIGANG